MKSVLFVGAGRHQRRAIARVRELGARVVAVDRNPDAPGLAEADVAEVADILDLDAVAAAGERHGVAGVMTVASDRAVPVVAAVAERLALPGIGSETAHAMVHKVAMRRRLAEHGVPQPQFAAARTLHGARAAARTTGYPAVLKPADSAGQRGIFLLRSEDDLDAHLHAALAASPTEEAILETSPPPIGCAPTGSGSASRSRISTRPQSSATCSPRWSASPAQPCTRWACETGSPIRSCS